MGLSQHVFDRILSTRKSSAMLRQETVKSHSMLFLMQPFEARCLLGYSLLTHPTCMQIGTCSSLLFTWLLVHCSSTLSIQDVSGKQTISDTGRLRTAPQCSLSSVWVSASMWSSRGDSDRSKKVISGCQQPHAMTTQSEVCGSYSAYWTQYQAHHISSAQYFCLSTHPHITLRHVPTASESPHKRRFWTQSTIETDRWKRQ